MARFTVVVGNIGQTMDTADQDEARASFDEYVTDSKNGYGRAAHEPVSLFQDGDLIAEYSPADPDR